MELNAGFLIHNNVGRCVCNIWMSLTKLKTAGAFASADFFVSIYFTNVLVVRFEVCV